MRHPAKLSNIVAGTKNFNKNTPMKMFSVIVLNQLEIWATSKTWIHTLDPDPEKPGPKKPGR